MLYFDYILYKYVDEVISDMDKLLLELRTSQVKSKLQQRATEYIKKSSSLGINQKI